ncbi:MAG TPA: GNAT family N-acetyltransferase [Pyrinomonadaceae bacterium]|nr:GNAT family N-acetyltransferase [Pyrinomonadaceae bacterium]
MVHDGGVLLSLFVPADAAVLCDGDHDPEHRRWFDFPADFRPSNEHSLNVIARWNQERLEGKRFPFAVRDAVTGELLAGCELRPLKRNAANVAYWTYPTHRRRGVAMRAVALLCVLAFEEFRFQRLEIVAHPDNVGSTKVALRNGFTEVGVRDGLIVYSMSG